MLRIVTDGAIDMPSGWARDYEIEVIPLYVRFGEDTYQPGVDIDGKKFYELVQKNSFVPKSSLPSPNQVIEFYKKVSQKGDEILSIHIASKMSGTFSVVQMAAKELVQDFVIHTFDSGAGSAALAFMCKEARVLNRSGASTSEIIKRLENIREKLTVIFTVENLEFARLSGRVNSFQTAITSMLRIKPIIILKDGLLQMAEKVRSRHKSIERIITLVKERVGNRLVNVAVVHAADPLTADWIVNRLREILNIKELITTELSIPVAANLGPGTVGIIAYPVETGEKL